MSGHEFLLKFSNFALQVSHPLIPLNVEAVEFFMVSLLDLLPLHLVFLPELS